MSYALLPPGRYSGEITNHDVTTMGTKKTPCIVIDVQLEKIGDLDGQTKTVVYWITERAAPIAVKALRELGFTDPDITQLQGGQQSAGLIGTLVTVLCKHQPDAEGNPRERLSLYNSVTHREPVGGKDLQQVVRLFRSAQEELYSQEEGNGHVEETAALMQMAPPKVAQKKPQEAGGVRIPAKRSPARMTRDVPF